MPSVARARSASYSYLRLPNSWTRCAPEVLPDDTKSLRANTYDSIGATGSVHIRTGACSMLNSFSRGYAEPQRVRTSRQPIVRHRCFGRRAQRAGNFMGDKHCWPAMPVSAAPRLRVKLVCLVQRIPEPGESGNEAEARERARSHDHDRGRRRRWSEFAVQFVEVGDRLLERIERPSRIMRDRLGNRARVVPCIK